MKVLGSSSPYPWPCGGPVAADRIALVVAGFAARWVAIAPDRGGAAVHMAAIAARLADLGGTVITLAQPVPTRCSTSIEVEPASIAGALAMATPGLDGCYSSPLEPFLRAQRIDHVLLAGYGLEGPVHSTMRGLNDRGYECLLVSDACTVIDESLRAGSISSIEMSGGIFGAVASSAAVLDALDTTA